MQKIYVVEAKRSAIGSFNGALANVSCDELGSTVAKEVIRNVDPDLIDEVIIGNVLSAGLGQNIARQIQIKAGIPNEKCAYSVNMVCGSGMKALMNGVQAIMSNSAEMVLVGGIENMSRAPYILPSDTRTGKKMGDFKVVDSMIYDALTDAFSKEHMGVTAEKIAEMYNVSREEQDTFAYESQKRAIKSIESGRFKDEIVPIEVKQKRCVEVFETDEYPNRKTDMERLSKLKPAFKKDGTVTAGNASGINDGCALILLASEECVKKNGLKPLAEIVSVSQKGIDPSIMGMGPVKAVIDVIEKAEIKFDEIDLFELNEAFAVQSLAVMKEISQKYNVDIENMKARTNVNGGAIALGHPVGASGARILVSLLYELRRSGKKYGVASLCIGGGMGTAVLMKNCE
ncbi:MAG: acetyl-CoA C-acetyltransferase [Lachnospiraceae bacterium]|nr:acetyl-CoA C-acetyltransferase [Lachnospiraceae bacterium]